MGCQPSRPLVALGFGEVVARVWRINTATVLLYNRAVKKVRVKRSENPPSESRWSALV
jgi:hypothetical protein